MTQRGKKKSTLDRRVSLKMEPELYTIIEKMAMQERRSINNMILFLLEEVIEARGIVANDKPRTLARRR